MVCISGPSGSGKTSLAEALAFRFPRSAVISQDAFYRRDLKEGESFESASSFDWNALVGEIEQRRTQASVVIVEGFCLLSCPTPSVFDVVIVLDCERELAMQRRLRRDAAAMGDPANSQAYFEQVVWPAHQVYQNDVVKKSVIHLSLSVTETTSIRSMVEQSELQIRQQLRKDL